MTITQEAVDGYVVLTGTVEWDEVAYWSRCPELGVASCGDTVEEALDNLGDALELQLMELADIGRLERDFQENGITVKTAPLPAEAVNAAVPVGRTIRVYVLPVPVPVAAAV